MRRISRLRGHRCPAFTLIELLVVVAIIALLIAILLPALGRARIAGWLAVSMSNIRQATMAATIYRDANKGFWPVTPVELGSVIHRPMYEPFSGHEDRARYASFSFGGGNCSGAWTVVNTGRIPYDVHAAERPLNPYLYPEFDFAATAPPFGIRLLPDAPQRKLNLTPVLRDPSDKVGHQQNWSDVVPPTQSENDSPRLTCYQDVGNSYHYNAKWVYQLYPVVHDVGKAFMEGTRRLALGSGYEPSRMVWLNDEHTDVVVYNWRPGASLQHRNGYADINKGVLSYCDGHSKYTTVRPGATVETFSNTDYTFVFDP